VWLSADPVISDVSLLELSGHLRITSDPHLGLRTLAECLEDRLDKRGRVRADERRRIAATRRQALSDRNDRRALAARGRRPIDPVWLGHQLGHVIDDEAILLDDTLGDAVKTYCRGDRPHSYFAPEGSAGGWGPGAALGAKIAGADRDVVLVSGDGFYAYGIPSAALWSAARYDAPYLAVVCVNARYSTGTSRVDSHYPGGYAA